MLICNYFISFKTFNVFSTPHILLNNTFCLNVRHVETNRRYQNLIQIFGHGNFGNPPTPPCKFVIGTRDIHVKAGKREAHTRTIKVTKPYKRCRCVLEENQQAAKIPDCNRAENLFNLIEMELKKQGRKSWPKNKNELKQRITKIIGKIPKRWFKKSFKNLPKCWREIVKRRGRLSDYYIPKERKGV